MFILYKYDKIFHNSNSKTKPKNIVIPNNKTDDNICISFVGHATFLIQTIGLNILTGTVSPMRVNPFSFNPPKKVTELESNFMIYLLLI